MADLNKFVEEIEKLSVLELNDLVKMLEEKFGVSAAAQVAVAGNAGAGVGTVFSGHLRHSGAEKVRHAGYSADGDAVQPPYLKERGQQLRQFVCHPAAQRDRAGGHCNADRCGHAGGAEQLRFAGAEGRREKAQ